MRAHNEERWPVSFHTFKHSLQRESCPMNLESRRRIEYCVISRVAECVICEQRLGEFCAKFAISGCHTGGPVRRSVAGRGKDAISHFHSPNRCSSVTLYAHDPIFHGYFPPSYLGYFHDFRSLSETAETKKDTWDHDFFGRSINELRRRNEEKRRWLEAPWLLRSRSRSSRSTDNESVSSES